MSLPERTLDTMSDAIALSSPSGRMSKRARQLANKRLSEALFGPGGLPRPSLPKQPTEKEYLQRRIKECEGWIEAGFKPRSMRRLADKLAEQLAALP